MSIPQFPNFKYLEISDKQDIENLTSQFPPYSDFNFVSFWSYNYGDNQFCFLNGNLVINMPDYISNEPLYSFLGKHKIQETIKAILDFMESRKLKPQLRLLPEDSVKDNILQIKKKYLLEEDRDSFDYILSIDKMSSLKDIGFRKQRNMVRKFNKTFPSAQLRELDIESEAIQKEILELTNIWGRKKNKTNEEIEHEIRATQNLLKISKFLKLDSIGIYVDQQLIAFYISEVIGNDYALGHFRKANIDYSGAFQYIDHRQAQILKTKGCKYFNYEQDLGIESMRKAKLSWQPVGFLKKYTLFT